MRRPTYVRVVVTTACPLRCVYCHQEGDPQREGFARRLDTDDLVACLKVAARAGIRKFKFLGGEPLSHPHMAHIVAQTRLVAPEADLSVITSGVGGREKMQRLMDAGLDRANVSIHGWSLPAFGLRGGRLASHRQRAEILDLIVDGRRPVKLNYVYTGPEVDEDLKALLQWAADRPVLVGLLDDLTNQSASAGTVFDALRRLHGPWSSQEIHREPDCLPTTHLRWADGLWAEVKTSRVGETAPWVACGGCPERALCREGIFALRLSHDGQLRLCKDREDLAIDLASLASRDGDAALAAWNGLLAEQLA